jgi:fatty-acyl-CoA synthase
LGAHHDDWFPKQTYGSLTIDAARKWPSRTALEYEDRRWTFAEVDDEVRKVAKALINFGVAPKSHVGIWITNRPEFIFLFFAIVRIGAVAVPLNTRWRQSDLQSGMEVVDLDYLFSETRSGPIEYEKILAAAVAESSADCRRLSFDRVVTLAEPEHTSARSWDQFVAGASNIADALLDERTRAVSPDDLCTIIFTSGSTGRPKGVMLSHRGIRSATDRATMLGMTRNDIQINYLPLFHNYSLAWITIQNMITGASQILMHRFDAEEVLRLITTRKVTMLHGFEAHFYALVGAMEAHPHRYDLSSLRVGSHSVGSESGLALIRKVQTMFCRTLSGYGMSETWSAVTCDHPQDLAMEDACHAVGYPLPGVELKIVDLHTKKELPEGRSGEISVKATSMMLGYYRNEPETRKAVSDTGWLYTGDAGFIRPDGRLRYLGRYKDLIRVGGENVDPTEIEALLMNVEGVQQAVTVAAPDEQLTEIVAAAIVPLPNYDPDQIVAAIQSAFAGRIASFKVPKRFKFLDQIPITGSEKVDRMKLRAMFAE